jgi:hypothetical protein
MDHAIDLSLVEAVEKDMIRLRKTAERRSRPGIECAARAAHDSHPWR